MPNQNSVNLNIQNQLLQSLAGLSIAAGNKILMSTSGAGATAGSLDHSVGNNANGFFLRLGNYQACWISLFRLNFTNTVQCSATWTFPAAFKTATIPVIFAGNPRLTNAAPNDRQISTFVAGSISNSSAIIRIYHVTGQTEFASGNFVDCDVLAIGEWQ